MWLLQTGDQRMFDTAGAGRAAAKPDAIMASPVTAIEQLERFLLRRGVGALEADRHRCADCGRTPLTGEHVHIYASATRSASQHLQRIVCELCRPARRESPVASELVRHCEHGHTVRLTAHAA
jgi:hypothetical protein